MESPVKRTLLLVTSTLFLGLAAFYALGLKNNSFPHDSKGMRLADSLELSDEKLLKVKRDALDGSPSEGYHLLEYYDVYKGDRAQAMYWAQIAAENGEARNAFDYASLLSDDKDNVMSLIRARFWAKRAV